MSRLIALLTALIVLATASPALAQATRTWVSGVGDDANPCSRTAPCKTFAGAISKTAAGGEINVIDPGGFGAVTITKSITIDGEGAEASILAAGVNGIIVNGAGIVVTLRNLSINGAGTTTGNGIRIINAAGVIIDNVTIMNFAGSGTNGRGISVETSAANVHVSVRDSRIFNSGTQGIRVQPSAGNVLLTVDRTHLDRGNFSAVTLIGNVVASVSNSTITNTRAGAGISTSSATTVANVSNSIISNNLIGIQNGTSGASITRLYGTVVTGNAEDGIRITAGSVFTHGNNAIRGNAGNETPTQPSIGLQ